MSHKTLIETDDGSHTVFSETFGTSYHSHHGAAQESQHVFMAAGLLPVLARADKKPVKVLDMGMGTGLNALLALAAAEGLQAPVQYEGIEAYPLTTEEAGRLNYTDILSLTQHQPLFMAMHQCPWDELQQLGPCFSFLKRRVLFEDLEPMPDADVIFFDAFSPAAQPWAWKSAFLAKMHASLVPGGVLVTYCAKGVVKRTLRALGFTVEGLPGPAGKREMTRATKMA